MAKLQNDNVRLKRMLFILNRLDEEGTIVLRDLADELDVSLRSIQRDLAVLQEMELGIEPVEKGVYSFSEGVALKKPRLSEEEAAFLPFLQEIVRSLGDNFEELFGGIVRKFMPAEYDSSFYAKLPSGVKLRKEYPFIKVLDNAIDQWNKVRLRYKSAKGESDYTLKPFKISFYDGFWYLLAQKDGEKKVRTFRLDNIRSVRKLEAGFAVPENLQELLDESVNIWFSGERDTKVILEVAEPAARYFKQRSYVPLQKIVNEHKDGSLTVETMISADMEVLPAVFQWIPHITVQEPAALRDKVTALVSEYLSRIA